MNLDLYTFKLDEGNHDEPSQGVCAMEAVAWMAGEPHSDKPACACPVLGAFIIRVNDTMDNADRSLLNPLILKLIGTRSKEHEKLRRDHLIREVTRRVVPLWFDRAGLTEDGRRLRDLSPIAPLSDIRDAALRSQKAA